MMVADSRHSRGRWAAPLLVIFTGAIAYSNSLHGPFIFDDIAAIVRNPQIRSLNPYKYHADGTYHLAGQTDAWPSASRPIMRSGEPK